MNDSLQKMDNLQKRNKPREEAEDFHRFIREEEDYLFYGYYKSNAESKEESGEGS